MKALLIRSYKQDSTPGTLFINDDNGDELLFVETLELPWKQNKQNISCVLPRTYIVKKRFTEKFKWHFHLQDVEERTWILIHPGNYTRQIQGCILPGLKHKDIDGDGIIDVVDSKKAMDKLLAILPDEFELEIR